VASESIVAKLRAKAGAELVVDLCQEDQWEVAARAGTTTFWPTGGTTGETFAAHTNQVNGFVAWYGSTGSTAQSAVGTKPDNGWGLYDVIGLAGEWTLDATAGTSTIPARNRLPDAYTDPVGGSGCARRVLRSASGNGATTGLNELLPCRRQIADPSWRSYSTRFCIHLKPLVKEGGQP
jgi:formylglycine-generating enzyme required for sulfatase activity